VTAAYLAGYLTQSGPAMAGANGMAPLTSAELAAWAAGRRLSLAGWEFQAILDASRAYVGQYQGDDLSPPDGMQELPRANVASRLKGLASAMKKG